MSARSETAQFYCAVDELEADSGGKTDDDTNAKDKNDKSKTKKNTKIQKIVEGMVRCLPQQKERAFGHPKTHKEEWREENKDWKKRWEITEKELAQLKSAYDAEVLKSLIQQTQIHDLEREKAELLNRLSKLAGDRLTHENLNITDLSDVHRPIKLSDTYCDLYDNEWTDAFQELTDNGLTVKEAVGTLLDIILVCFHKCREITWERYQTLKHIVSTIDIAHVPWREQNLSEVWNIDACTNNAPDESAIEYSRDKESLHSPQPKEEVDSPDICNNASNKLEISYSLDEEVERPSQSDEVCNQDISNNASKSEIASNANKKVGQPSQCEETEVKGDGEIFPKSNGTDLDEQNRLERTVEYTTSVSDPYICTNNPPKDLEQLYSGKREVQRSKESKDEQYGSVKARKEDTERRVLVMVKQCLTPPDDLKMELIAPWMEEAIDNITLTNMVHKEARPEPQKIAEIQRENIILKRHKEEWREENKDWKKRLSKLAGDRLTHENLNITDLNDVHRPTKLSDTYCELYDNEWTDAFQELTDHGLTDKEAVRTLLDILLVCFHKCREITWERYQTLKHIVSTIDIVHIPRRVENLSEVSDPFISTNNISQDLDILCSGKREVQRSKQSKEEHFTATVTLHFEQEKQIKDIWRTTTTALKNEAVKHLYLVLLTRFDIPIKDMEKTSKYLTSCINLCWKMGVQEQPMHLEAVAEKDIDSEKIFDQDKFKAFTKSGEGVDFVVWPALFLHEGGPMLFKGIAQGCKKSDK